MPIYLCLASSYYYTFEVSIEIVQRTVNSLIVDILRAKDAVQMAGTSGSQFAPATSHSSAWARTRLSGAGLFFAPRLLAAKMKIARLAPSRRSGLTSAATIATWARMRKGGQSRAEARALHARVRHTRRLIPRRWFTYRLTHRRGGPRCQRARV